MRCVTRQGVTRCDCDEVPRSPSPWPFQSTSLLRLLSCSLVVWGCFRRYIGDGKQVCCIEMMSLLLDRLHLLLSPCSTQIHRMVPHSPRAGHLHNSVTTNGPETICFASKSCPTASGGG